MLVILAFYYRLELLTEVGVVVVAFEVLGADAERGDQHRLIGVLLCQPVSLRIVRDHVAQPLRRWVG